VFFGGEGCDCIEDTRFATTAKTGLFRLLILGILLFAGAPHPHGNQFGILAWRQLLLLRLAPQDDIHSTPGHVSGDGDSPLASRLRNDDSFLLVVFCIQNVMRNAMTQRLIEVAECL